MDVLFLFRDFVQEGILSGRFVKGDSLANLRGGGGGPGSPIGQRPSFIYKWEMILRY